jgi:hypothetical protein
VFAMVLTIFVFSVVEWRRRRVVGVRKRGGGKRGERRYHVEMLGWQRANKC